MRKTLIALAAVAAALAPQFAAAQNSGQWLLRARALYLQSDNSDSTGLDLKINDKAFPEFDVSYFFTPNIATELVLTYPQRHTIRSGDTIIGSLKHLPPTLTLQYHFTGLQALRPYLGAGVNYTRFSSVSFEPAVDAALDPSVKKNSFGWALQAGVDVPMSSGWLLNFDIKKVQIETDVKSAGTKVGTFKVNPLLIGVGVGKRF
ncbi:MAG TPA: OmpW family outer membrane protein [Ideonella sp.]|uniref:OmpW/AlkL family protein n=1 Tax=Ideonella sp. TaxID=1929293 RepID=UPI002BABA241|nr:OmpW family outer membrane protein [Ideonella sp.]HSI50131.1 OmpW family outer membrane protein [Ideonella sp.]